MCVCVSVRVYMCVHVCECTCVCVCDGDYLCSLQSREKEVVNGEHIERLHAEHSGANAEGIQSETEDPLCREESTIMEEKVREQKVL